MAKKRQRSDLHTYHWSQACGLLCAESALLIEGNKLNSYYFPYTSSKTSWSCQSKAKHGATTPVLATANTLCLMFDTSRDGKKLPIADSSRHFLGAWFALLKEV